MNQNTCKTCKWWQWNNDLGFTTGSGEFIPWGTPPIRFVCGGTGQWNAADGMVDAEDYGGVLTGPDFGCIHYEETQEQLPQDHPGYEMQQTKRKYIWQKQPCGHTGVLSIYPDKNGNGQCTACANEMRRLHPGEVFSVGL